MPTLTNIDIITRALRKINVNPEGVTPSAEQTQDSLDEMNSMINRWLEEDVNIQYFSQTEASDPFPCHEYTHQGVIGQLAVAIAGNYGIPVPAELSNPLGTGYADVGWQTILRKAMNDNLPRADLSHLPQGSGKRRNFDIEWQ